MTPFNPLNYAVHGILWARILEWVAFPFSKGSSQPRSPALQVDSLPAEPQGKPKNTGLGNLSLLQGICPTQESNWGLLHFRQILYQLNYQGSLHKYVSTFFQVIFPLRLLQNTEQSSLCYIVGPCLLPTVYIAVRTHQSQTP